VSTFCGSQDYEDIPDGIIDRARSQCPDNMAGYDSYAAEVNRQYEETFGDESSSSPAEDDSSAESDSSVQDYLASRGVSDDMVRQLGAMADMTGYGLDADTPLPFAQAQNFASVIVMTCEEVASGSLTWPESIARDVTDGASLAHARHMNGYLRDVFCPQVS
jgi:hypothetical protein